MFYCVRKKRRILLVRLVFSQAAQPVAKGTVHEGYAMRQVTTEELSSPAAAPEVLAFRAQFGGTVPLDELVRVGAQQMLQAAINAEVSDFVGRHAERRDERGNR